MLSVTNLILSLMTTYDIPFSDSPCKATLHTIINVRTNKSNTKEKQFKERVQALLKLY